MIDLRNKELPNAITVDGNSFLIQTDFRYWIEFSEKLKKKDTKLKEYFFLFTGKIPKVPFMNELLNFYSNPNSTPRLSSTESNDPVIDYVQDGEFIVSSFFQAYHIDLTRTDYMHWHLFKALLNGLPSNTYMKEIMAMRSYKKETKTYEQQQKYLKNIWALGNSESRIVDQETMDEINALFYNS